MSEAKEGSSRRDFLKMAGGFAAGAVVAGTTRELEEHEIKTLCEAITDRIKQKILAN